MNRFLVYAAWLISLSSMAGSLFFSEVMELRPYVLCWYQRIAMYPLVLIIGVGIILNDRRMKPYALPFALIGLAIAVYHNRLYYGFIPESITPCTQGISCTSRQIESTSSTGDNAQSSQTHLLTFFPCSSYLIA